jgi:hypothetical protein
MLLISLVRPGIPVVTRVTVPFKYPIDLETSNRGYCRLLTHLCPL